MSALPQQGDSGVSQFPEAETDPRRTSRKLNSLGETLHNGLEKISEKTQKRNPERDARRNLHGILTNMFLVILETLDSLVYGSMLVS